jgi:hypothetical protein
VLVEEKTRGEKSIYCSAVPIGKRDNGKIQKWLRKEN